MSYDLDPLRLPFVQNAVPLARSYELPNATQTAVQVASAATDHPFHLMIRVVDPAGEFGIFAFSSTALNGKAVVPVGETVIIPVGQWQPIVLGPGMFLYARGTNQPANPNVVVSITGYPLVK